LLVVTAITSILLALMLSAVQRVREAAWRVKCINRMKQIGLALHGFHESHRYLPPGVSGDSPREPFQRMSWLTRLLPDMEHEQLWRQAIEAYRLDRVPFDTPPHTGLYTVVTAFTCPSDYRVDQTHDTHRNRRVALTSYVGNLGTDYRTQDGVLFRDSSITLTDIADGTSNTLAAGERPPSPDFWYGWWYAGVGQSRTGSGDMLIGSREIALRAPFVKSCARGPYHFRPGQVNEQCDLFHYWSLHNGGGHFLFCDGSVRFLAYSADSIMPALATRAKGEAVEAP
jgi:prepilin-type processing-associated H-X9-DG protein